MLKPDFFQRSALEVAPDLLGKYLVANNARLMIVETEAYEGVEDLASHASGGKTARNQVMFEAGGTWYVYLCYGMHWMLNMVTGERDYPSAVLIRGARGFNGPGKLTKHLGINKRFNALQAHRRSGLWIEDNGAVIAPKRIATSPRIGVAYAGPIWSQKPWRFRLKS